MNLIFFHGFCIFPFLIINVILIKVHFIEVRDIRSGHSALFERIPIEAWEPGVILDLLVTIVTKSFLSPSSQAFVNKIGGILWPSSRNVLFFDGGLLGYNMLPDFPSSLSEIWSPAKHAFPSYDTDSKVIGSDSMVSFAHDFWRHIPGSSRCFIRVIDISDPFSGDTKVCQFEIPVLIKDKVLGLDIPMNYHMAVHSL